MPDIDGEGFDVSMRGFTLNGGDAGEFDGGAIVSAVSGVLELDQMTVADNTARNGGGIFATSATINITNSNIYRNVSNAEGGAISVTSGAVTVTNSSMSYNVADLGGRLDGDGGAIKSEGLVTINNSILRNNVARSGGAVSADAVMAIGSRLSNNRSSLGGAIAASSATVMTSTISGNSSTGRGGGIGAGSLTLVGSAVYGNTSVASGGGASARTVTISNSTVSGNASDEEGGGLFGDVLVVSNSTIFDNTATIGGGLSVNDSLILSSSILAGNHAQRRNDLHTANDVSLDVEFSLLGDHSGTQLTAAPTGMPDIYGNLIGTFEDPLDPLLDPLSDNGGPTLTHAPRTGSPVLDAGFSLLAGDQRGFQRVINFDAVPDNPAGGNGVDIGAVEIQDWPATFFSGNTTVEFETASDLDLSAMFLNHGGELLVTLAVSDGEFGAPKDGSPYGVVASLVDPQTITLAGEDADINRYVDLRSNLSYMPAAGAVGQNAATIDLTVSRGTFTLFSGFMSVDITEPISFVVTTSEDVVDRFDSRTSLREAVMLANRMAGENTISFSDTMSGQTIILTDGHLPVWDPLTIDANHLSENVTMDAQLQSEVFLILDTFDVVAAFDVSLSGLTITGGLGGIVFQSRGLLTVTDSVVAGNSAERGGGIYVGSNGRALIKNSLVRDNDSTFRGGGIFLDSGGDVSIEATQICHNFSGSSGGGIFVTRGSVLSIGGSTICHNGSERGTGGVALSSSTLTISNSTVHGNYSMQSDESPTAVGGISADWTSNVAISNTTINQNDGSGIYLSNDSRSFAMRNSIIAGNSNFDVYYFGNNTDIKFSIIGSNSGAPSLEPSPQLPDALGNLIGTDDNPVDLRLGPLSDNGGASLTQALLDGSPAIDAGDPFAIGGVDGVPLIDQRGAGFVRVSQGRMDMGAFEVQAGLPGDFDNSGSLDCTDVDRLSDEIALGTADLLFDLDRDGLVDFADLELWLRQAGAVNHASAGAYLPGDANLDGAVDVSDFNIWNEHKFTATTGWCSGDFNADGFVEVSDYNIWNERKFLESDGAQPIVLEPAGFDFDLRVAKQEVNESESAIDRVFRDWTQTPTIDR
ncbi:MAG: choice-of-anchor Q domain-containing protein [Planctomycetota bacterium]